MAGKPQGWSQLPEYLLLKIMSHLDHRSVGWSCSLTCKSWHSISKDNLLWRKFVNRDLLKQEQPLRDHDPGISWISEYKRMFDFVPCQLLQTISTHMDEVIHISFSHDGNNFVAISKDMNFSVWQLQQEGTFLDIYRQDMFSFNWLQALSSRFNPEDTRLLICGIADTIEDHQTSNGEVAVLSTGRDNDRFQILFFIKDVPFDLSPCWLSEDQLISASLKTVHTENMVACCRMTLWQHLAEDPRKRSSNSAICCQLMELTSSEDICPCRNLMAYSRKGINEQGDLWGNAIIDMQDYGVEDREELIRARNNPLRSRLKEALEGKEHCLVFFTSSHSWAPHQIGFQRMTSELLSNPCRLRRPEKVIECGGQIIGASISPQEDTLYVNVRKWPMGVDASTEQINELLPISEDVELLTINLATMEVREKKLLGHRGFSPPEKAFHLYVNSSTDFVSSGSEDGLARIWDRRHGVDLATLEHDECVNCAVFSPTDQEICVTGSDDYKIKVWISRRRSREIQAAECKPPTNIPPYSDSVGARQRRKCKGVSF